MMLIEPRAGVALANSGTLPPARNLRSRHSGSFQALSALIAPSIGPMLFRSDAVQRVCILECTFLD